MSLTRPSDERGRCDGCGKFWRWADLGHMDSQGQVNWCPRCVKKHQAAEADRVELVNFADLLRAKAGQMPTGEAPQPVCVCWCALAGVRDTGGPTTETTHEGASAECSASRLLATSLRYRRVADSPGPRRGDKCDRRSHL